MDNSGHFHRRFPPSLNPTAPEFRPTYPNPNTHPQPHPPPSPSTTYYSYSYPNYNFNNPLPPISIPVPPVTVTVPVPMTIPVHVPPPLPPPSLTPTRALLLSSVPSDVSESIVRRDLERFGDVRAVQMDKVRDGLVTVHFYDLRQATEALHEIQEQHMQQQYRLRKHFDSLTLFSPENHSPTSYFHHANNTFTVPLPPPAPGLVAGRAVWAQYAFPVAGGFPDSYNQGTLVVFNLNSDVSTGMLREIFEAFGPVKELRGTPLKRNQKFVEFYDTRDAGKALVDMNGKVINGQPVVVEFSRPGGHKFGPKHNRFVSISGSNSGMLSRKFAMVARHCRPSAPSPLPAPPQQQLVRKNVKKQQPEPSGGMNVSWGKQRKGFRRERDDPRFLIKEDGVISEADVSDSRTTVMIKNIPNKYSQKLLLNMLDSHCIHCNEQITGGDDGGGDCGFEQPMSSYDFVYLPIDFMNKCNVGYGFVNMTSPEATMRLYKAFHHKNWEVFNSKKICEVSYARLQGLDALKEHFKNSKFPNEAEEYMPVVFDPPRDGRRLTQATPIVGRTSVAASDHDLCMTDTECCNSSSNATVVEEDVESHDNDDDETYNPAAGYSGGGD